MDAQLAALRHGFTLFPDPRRGEKPIPLADIVMSGFAMFSPHCCILFCQDREHFLTPISRYRCELDTVEVVRGRVWYYARSGMING